jgi:hypothetical protein
MGTMRMSLVSGVLAALLATCDGHAAERAAESAAERAAERVAERVADSAADETRMALDTTVISASQELPKVLYIVPWRTPTGRPDLPATAGVVDDGFWQPLRPQEHRREILYQETPGGGSPKE